MAMAISTVRLESNDDEKDRYDGKEANRINRIKGKKREQGYCCRCKESCSKSY